MTSPLERVLWPVRTDRLSLRPATIEDLDTTWRFRRLGSVNRWLSRAPRTLEEHRRQFTEPGSLEKTIVIELDGEVIGDLMIGVEDGWAQADVAEDARGTEGHLGWVLDPAHTGRGYATEAVREVLRISFEDLGLRRVEAGCFAANEASWRLMERVGMRREAHNVRESLHRDGGWMDGFTYALLADEWER
jgi:RimJ/RimL family protein N-acetyltransferase